MQKGHSKLYIYSKMGELWHNQLSCKNNEEPLLFQYPKGTLLEQDVISKKTIEVRTFHKIFCDFAAAW